MSPTLMKSILHDGIEVLAAAYLALNQIGDGSSPSGPTLTLVLGFAIRRERP